MRSGPFLLAALLLFVSLLGVSACGGTQISGRSHGVGDSQDSASQDSAGQDSGGVRDSEQSAGGEVRGSGAIRTEDRPVRGFSRIEVTTFGTLTVTQSGSESLRIEADDNILPLLTSEVRGDTLQLGIRPNTSISNAHVAYTVTVASLDAVELSGSGKAKLIDIDTSALLVSLSGSGGATSNGRADNLRVDIAGSGDYDGSNTVSKTATVQIEGSGEAVLQVSDTLDADLSGSGDVEYIGNPKVTQDVSGSGSVRRRR